MASIRKRTLPSGKVRWQADYVDQSGRRRSRQFDLKADASAFLDHARVEVRQGTHTADSDSITVADACELWLTTVALNRREASTLDQYRGHVRNHIGPLIGSLKLLRLTTPRCAEFRDQLMARCSPATARKVWNSFGAMLKDAQLRGKVAQNPALPVSIRHGADARDDDGAVIPPIEHLHILLDAVSDGWRALLVTAALCGLRPSELRGLTWDHVDFEDRVIRVRQRADKRNQIGRPKTRRSNRDVPMSPMVVNTLKAHRLACPKGPANLVFPNSLGKPLHVSDLSRRLWLPLLQAAKLTNADGAAPYAFKHLRHFAASLWIKSGAQPKWVQKTMGHSSIRVTMDVYARLWEDAEEDQANAAAAERRLMSGRNTDATRIG